MRFGALLLGACVLWALGMGAWVPWAGTAWVLWALGLASWVPWALGFGPFLSLAQSTRDGFVAMQSAGARATSVASSPEEPRVRAASSPEGRGPLGWGARAWAQAIMVFPFLASPFSWTLILGAWALGFGSWMPWALGFGAWVPLAHSAGDLFAAMHTANSTATVVSVITRGATSLDSVLAGGAWAAWAGSASTLAAGVINHPTIKHLINQLTPTVIAACTAAVRPGISVLGTG